MRSLTTNTAPGSAGQNGALERATPEQAAESFAKLPQSDAPDTVALRDLKFHWGRGGMMGGRYELLANNDDVCLGYFYADGDDDVDVDAALTLMTAAPQMLDALRELQLHWHHMIGMSSPPEFHRLNDKLESAIAAATGESTP